MRGSLLELIIKNEQLIIQEFARFSQSRKLLIIYYLLLIINY